jgi:hypothetical protein
MKQIPADCLSIIHHGESLGIYDIGFNPKPKGMATSSGMDRIGGT